MAFTKVTMKSPLFSTLHESASSRFTAYQRWQLAKCAAGQAQVCSDSVMIGCHTQKGIILLLERALDSGRYCRNRLHYLDSFFYSVAVSILSGRRSMEMAMKATSQAFFVL